MSRMERRQSHAASATNDCSHERVMAFLAAAAAAAAGALFCFFPTTAIQTPPAGW